MISEDICVLLVSSKLSSYEIHLNTKIRRKFTVYIIDTNRSLMLSIVANILSFFGGSCVEYFHDYYVLAKHLQALCEELTKKAADLAWENENLKKVGSSLPICSYRAAFCSLSLTLFLELR